MTAAPVLAGRLVDGHGRVARDLRISLTDRCDLRCRYCMPAEGLEWLARTQVLDDAEISRLVRIAVERLGIREVRFTGGEPLLRPGLPAIVRAAAELRPRPELAVTTNGVRLARRAAELADAGLDRVNVSLDTLRADRFAALTRRDRLADVLAGLDAADRAGLTPIKINAVLLRGVNDDEAPDLLRFCLDRGYELRFIEQMPLDADHSWTREQMVTRQEILDDLGAGFTLTPATEPRGSAPAQAFLVDGGPARVGVIASVSAPFCHDCDRTRITADGQIRTCLFSREEHDLRGLLRGGASDEQIADAWQSATWGKPIGHQIAQAAFVQPDRPMSAIGG